MGYILGSGYSKLNLIEKHRKRYELKYRVSESIAHSIGEYIRTFMKHDPYSLVLPNRQYEISSLYFDSNDFDLLQHTLMGRWNRHKLRIRAYNSQRDWAFLEIKRRSGMSILKSRAKVMRKDVTRILNSFHIPDYCNERQRHIVEQFNYHKNTIQAQGKVIVRYKREAFVMKEAGNLRITFDRDLEYKRATNFNIDLDQAQLEKSPLGFVILEIKFTEHYPSWLTNIIRMFELDHSSMSKYIACVNTLNKQIHPKEVFS